MMKRMELMGAAAVACGLLVAGCDHLAGEPERPASVYVAPDGDDANDGVSRARPLRTPQAAVAAVKRLRAEGKLSGDVVVEFADGLYRLDRPVQLGKDDGGVGGASLVWRAAHRGKAVFNAATAVAWQPLKDEKVLALLPEKARGKVLVADVPGKGPLPSFLNGSHLAMPGKDIPIEVFAGETRLTCARFPNEGFTRTGIVEAEQVTVSTGKWAAKGGTFEYDRAKLREWAKEPFPWTFGLWKVEWCDLRAPLEGIDVEKGTIPLKKEYILFGLGEDKNFYVFNAFCELDRPGEWVVDRERRRVYLWPEEGKRDEGRGMGDECSEAAEVVVVDGLVRANGVKDFVLDGFVFEKARRNAVELRDCVRTTVRACAVRHTCSWGVHVEGGKACRVVGCDLYDLGEGGVYLTGGDHLKLERADHVAENNHIHHYGKVFYNYRQGVSLNGVGCSAIHNLVHHSPHTGIYGCGNDLTIAWNVIHDTCEFNDDAGAIYVWNYSFVRRGCLIEHNVVHMTGKKRFPANTEGIYLDDYSPENVVRYNFINRASLGIHLAGGQCNETYGNVLLNCARSLALSTRQPWANSQLGRKSRNFRELDAHYDVYSSEKWLKHYPGLAKLLPLKDPVLAHHAYWNVISNNVSAYSGEASKACWEAISNTTVWADNVACGDRDPGLADYFNFGWKANPGSPHAAVIDGCEVDKAGLYDSPDRLSPAVKFSADVTKPQPWGPASAPPTARVACAFSGKLPDGLKAFATETRGCVVASWSKGNWVDSFKGVDLSEQFLWRTYAYSFVPTCDATFVVSVMGGFGKEMTVYDGIAVTGVEDATDLFKDAQPFKANDKNRKSSKPLRCKKGQRVEVTFRCRAK